MNEESLTAEPAVGHSVRDWRTIYAGRMVITDLLVLIWVVFGVQIAWFGFETADVAFRGSASDLGVSYTTVSVLVIAGWLAFLQVFGTRESRVLGTGPDEYKLIMSASMRLFGLLAIAAFLLHIDVARGYILLAFPFGTVVLVFSRWIWRQWLCAKRLDGEFVSRVLLVGSQTSTLHLARELGRQPAAGYLVVGACIPGGFDNSSLPGTEIPVFSDIDELQAAMSSVNADTVIVTSSDELSPDRIRSISWGLEPGRQHLVVAPSLTDIGGPRIHTRPVSGLPLIHVEMPRYEGRKQFTKRAFDVLGSSVLLLALSPLICLIGLIVKFTSQGPVLYRQERIGMNGEPFNMLKFRSMTVNADEQLAGLLEVQGTLDSPLFKVRNDPRLTKIGGFLRKYSLDELLQLLNVLKGDMSLVGPRPQREGEVALYDTSAHRRLFVKPGMSGLWQVSGRSNLSWEDSIRLDLYYVENWSLAGDLVILWRTIRAVVSPAGAY
ncbi:sugar transferase [Cryobacterium sp. W22_MBD10_FK3]|uniref:sugar transferase n=1 Tax=Cryobacterium sp. W22_MBD10_FK3 TaxID=3240273 RepID=UPI003F901873